MIFILVILNYINDCKKIGKEKLAVSLSRRLIAYFRRNTRFKTIY